ncbi:MAG: PolC-type DNA polymerase III [Eubacteriales bacterium]|jgi:DNA polymerase-3 subunit alpha (Gram-positive type)|nr:PolC-type DNA polymerase III [Eubacteriales bacterium]
MITLAEFFAKVEDDLLKSGTIIKVTIKREDREVSITASFDKIIDFHKIQSLQKEICTAYKLKKAEILPRYDKGLFSSEFMPNLVEYISEKSPVAISVLSGATANVHGDTLRILLKNNGIQALEENGCLEAAKEIISEQFGINVNIEVAVHEETIEKYEKNKEEIVRKIEETNNARQKDDNPILYGREIKSAQITPISEIDEASGRVVIKGELFRKGLDTRETRNGSFIVSFDVTDFKSSITCKLFGIEKKELMRFEDRLKKGTNVMVRGMAQFDKYAREVLVMADDINIVPKEVRVDDAPVKRVELHLHTKMSFMDAMCDVRDVVQRAASWGHKAIAITDHGVVQAFPDAAQSMPKDFKVIFGMEAYLVDVGRAITFNGNNQGILENIVVFDVETTGFNPRDDRIIEIGAVKIKNGEVVDHFSCFVNPETIISPKITELTGITNEMVKDANTIEDVLPKFLEFCSDSVLVAHNAQFDIGFIRANADRLALNFSPTYIDTVEMARGALPDLPRHRLDVVAKALDVSLEGHHRAVNDANATAQIYLKLASKANVETVDQLNNAYNENESFKDKPYNHAVILAKNYTGLKNLYKIVSESHLNYFYKRPCVPKSVFFKYKEGLIIGSGCEQGELYQAILHGKSQKEIGEIVRMYDYLEIQPLKNNEFMVRSGTVKNFEELMAINKKIVELGEYYKKPVVATCDVHFLDEKDSIYRAILMEGQGYRDADEQAPLYLRTTEEMLAEFAYLGEEKAYEVVVTNTNKIADMIERMLPVPEGTFPPEMGNSKEEIIEMCNTRARQIYGDDLPSIVKERMDKELNAINKYGFSVMYLIAQRLVSKSNEDGYLVGSRGSVGSSFVAFLCGITEVNALAPHYVCPNCKNSEFITDGSVGSGVDMEDKSCPKCHTEYHKDGHDIPFETFLGFEGDKEPDIDLNFSGEYQPVAHKYTEELFGEGHVFRAGTISTLAEKTAYGYVKNYLEKREKGVSRADENRLVAGCSGVKRTTGQHPGGVMILPKGHDIHEFCPIQHPADDKSKGVITTHFDYHSLSGRLLKLDILGHDDPTMIKMLEDLTGVDARTIPLDDPKTMSLFSSTQALGVSPEEIGSDVGTFGVPELGTRFVRQMLVETKPSTFSELVRISGLSHGTDVWTNNAQDLVRQGIATLSEAICTRDDIMTYLIYRGLPSKAAFDIMERVRKGKGLTEEDEKLMREHEIPEWYIASCNKIKYMFPKAHAVAYITMALRIAWFKVHHPLAFYLAHFTVRADEFNAEIMCDPAVARKKKRELETLSPGETTQKDKNVLTILEIVIEMFARGIRFLPIDIYKSHATKFLGVDGNILPPLSALSGLGESAAESIVAQREIAPFSSIEDLLSRTSVSRTVAELMKQQGCLGNMPESDQITFF